METPHEEAPVQGRSPKKIKKSSDSYARVAASVEVGQRGW